MSEYKRVKHEGEPTYDLLVGPNGFESQVESVVVPSSNAMHAELYELLSVLREDIGKFRDKCRLQNDVDELDRLAGLANRAIGVLIED